MKLIIFDIGGVVLKADHKITHKILQNLGVLLQKSKLFFNNDEYKEFSRGNITPKLFYKALIRYLEADLTYQQIEKAHNDHLYDIDEGVISIISKLKLPIVFISDTNKWQTAREKEFIDLAQFSDKIFRSHEMHMLKIDPDCFPFITKSLNIKPNEVLLIDDSLEKIKAAKRFGLQTYHFKNNIGLKKYLISNELL